MYHLTAQTFYNLYQPSLCRKRLRLMAQNVEGSEKSELVQLLIERGKLYEKAYLADLTNIIEIPRIAEAPNLTLQHLQEKKKNIYQGHLETTITVGTQSVQLTGIPDFLIATSEGWIIQDVKLVRHVEERLDIIIQLNLYGYLLEQIIGEPPHRLQIVLGDNTIEDIPYHGTSWMLEQVKQVLIVLQDNSSYEPVGWSKCTPCTYYDICWAEAEKQQDVSLLIGVDQGLAQALYRQNCKTISDLVAQFTIEQLASLKKISGKGLKRVGIKTATSIIGHAQCQLTQSPKIFNTKEKLPVGPNWVMFDLEGLPLFEDGTQEIFIWGIRVFGEEPSQVIHSYATSDKDNDQTIWFNFLAEAKKIFEKYGDIAFVHWNHYEKTYVEKYIKRYGDWENVGGRILANLCDLLRIYEKTVYLPLYSRSLKQVEKFVGFNRRKAGYSGDKAIAHYWQALQENNFAKTTQVLKEICFYNEEDLEATWKAFEWLKLQLTTENK